MKNVLASTLSLGLWLASAASGLTIAEIALLPEGGHATSDPVVILSAVDLVPDPGFKSFQIRDTSRAMTVYGTNAEIDAVLAGFGVGDVIDIAGYTARRDGALVLVTGTVSGFAVSGRTSTAPLLTHAVAVTPPDIAVSYESNLVCLRNVSFAADGTFATGGNYSLLGGSAMVHIATAELGLTGQPIPAGPLDITGIVMPDPAGDGYVLAPRGLEDIVAVPEPATPVLLALGGLTVFRRGRKPRTVGMK